MSDRDHLFQQLCHEAVLACGADMAAIERYVLARLDAMDDAARERARRDLERVLSYKPPPQRSDRPH